MCFSENEYVPRAVSQETGQRRCCCVFRKRIRSYRVHLKIGQGVVDVLFRKRIRPVAVGLETQRRLRLVFQFLFLSCTKVYAVVEDGEEAELVLFVVWVLAE
jgi:hypothetical protein